LGHKIISAFESRFGHPPEIVTRAPGRVNLLGGHTDYNDGYVLPTAVSRTAWVAAAPLTEREIRIHALDLDRDVAFSLDTLPPPQGDWADYPRGVAWALQERGLRLVGMEATLTSNVPVGAGLSSSAAVEMALAYTWQQLSGFEIDGATTPIEIRRGLAVICQRAENDYVGVNCGIMDQLTSALGVEGHVLLLDCRTLEMKLAPLPLDAAIIAVDTGVRRQLANSEYNMRRAQCEEAVSLLSEHLPNIRALRDVSAGDLERLKKRLPQVIYRRAHHVVTENARTLRAAEALQEGDVDAVGALMKAGHISLRDDYEVSGPELNALAEAAWEVDGCYGARLTGAGFGGCIVALVAAEATSDFEAHVSAAYESAFDRLPDVYICRSIDGVKVLV